VLLTALLAVVVAGAALRAGEAAAPADESVDERFYGRLARGLAVGHDYGGPESGLSPDPPIGWLGGVDSVRAGWWRCGGGLDRLVSGRGRSLTLPRKRRGTSVGSSARAWIRRGRIDSSSLSAARCQAATGSARMRLSALM
jgi:hypothetical protein